MSFFRSKISTDEKELDKGRDKRQYEQLAQHGGLVSFVRKSLIAEELGSVAIKVTKTSPFRICMDKDKWTHLTKVHVPPSNLKGPGVIRLNTEIIQAL